MRSSRREQRLSNREKRALTVKRLNCGSVDPARQPSSRVYRRELGFGGSSCRTVVKAARFGAWRVDIPSSLLTMDTPGVSSKQGSMFSDATNPSFIRESDVTLSSERDLRVKANGAVASLPERRGSRAEFPSERDQNGRGQRPRRRHSGNRDFGATD